MALNTMKERQSAATVAQVYMPVSVVPSGGIEEDDRRQIGFGYAGMSDMPEPTDPEVNITVEDKSILTQTGWLAFGAQR